MTSSYPELCINNSQPYSFDKKKLSQASLQLFFKMLKPIAPSSCTDLDIYDDDKAGTNTNNDNDISMNHKYNDYYFLHFLNVKSINEMTNLIEQLKDYIPISDTPNLNEHDKKIEDLIITKTAKMLHMFIPILTSRVFMNYERTLKKNSHPPF